MSTAALAIFDDENDLMAQFRAEFKPMTPDEVLGNVRSALRMTAQSWLRVAAGIADLEEKGVDVARLRAAIGPFLGLLRRIASGQLLAAVVCRFYTQLGLVNRIGLLPTPDQKRLAAGERMAVLVIGPNGGYTSRMLMPDEMTATQLKQVFDGDHLRTETGQAAWLDGKRMEAAKPPRPQIGPFEIDGVRRSAVFVGKRGTVVDDKTLAEVLRAVRK